MENNKEVYRLSLSVAPGASGTLTRPLPMDGTIERLTMRVYSGNAMNLDLTPMVNGFRGRRYPIIDFVGKLFFEGDDDVIQEPISIPVKRAWELAVDYTNNSATDTLDFYVEFIVDHMAGTGRVI